MNNIEANFYDSNKIDTSYLAIPQCDEYCLIDINRIEPNPDQPRLNYSNDALDLLIRSIQSNGLIQPIVVQKVENRYRIIAGERRWRAYSQMGKQHIEAIIKSVDDKTNAIYALAENIAREDLSDYEISKAIRKIEENFPHKKDLAAMIGISRSDMYRYFAFESLPDFIQKDLDDNPRRLSRSAADQIKKLLTKHQNSNSVLSFLEEAWTMLKDGRIQQTHIPQFIQNKFKGVYGIDQSQDKDNITVNGENVGQITQSKNHWSVRLMTNKITESQQQQILEFIQQLFNEQVSHIVT